MTLRETDKNRVRIRCSKELDENDDNLIDEDDSVFKKLNMG
ncbi:MAG: hypothetical protein ACLTDF_00125 [Coprococcus sp.]